MTAREEVLLRGLIDWVALSSVHEAVEQENPGESLAVVQDRVLDLIHSLVTDGLFELGDLATPNQRFGTWDASLDESIQRIRDVYVTKFDDDPEWWFYCWLGPTEKGLEAAEAIEAAEQVKSASEEVLLWGLVDWVELDRIHRFVAQESPGKLLSVVQTRTLDLIRSLVTDGLFELGDLATPNHRFAAWDAPLDESLHRIRDLYVNQYDDGGAWWFYCWLDATEKGLKAAEAIEANRNSAEDR